jgi:hypothetical protein
MWLHATSAGFMPWCRQCRSSIYPHVPVAWSQSLPQQSSSPPHAVPVVRQHRPSPQLAPWPL